MNPTNKKPVLVMGLTGNIATGKSTVSQIFIENNLPVICADKIALSLTRKNTVGLNKIIEEFGESYLDSQGELDRNKLGELIFNNPESKKKLDRILHPLVFDTIKEEIKRLTEKSVPLIILDVPLLFETEMHKLCDKVLVVYAPKDIALQRLMARNNLTREQAQARFDSQMDIELKKKKADFVIDNSGSLENTRQQVKELMGQKLTF